MAKMVTIQSELYKINFENQRNKKEYYVLCPSKYVGIKDNLYIGWS